MEKGIIATLFVVTWLVSTQLPQSAERGTAIGQTVTVYETANDTLQLDKETSLVIDERLILVKAQCTACHSSKLIVQSHLTRDGWRQKIRWMQRTQKLWDLGESEPVVLDYLAKYYGPEDRSFDGRRLPLPKQKRE